MWVVLLVYYISIAGGPNYPHSAVMLATDSKRECLSYANQYKKYIYKAASGEVVSFDVVCIQVSAQEIPEHLTKKD